MRHSASLLASLEGLSRSAFRIASELSGNSRSGLTVRFLSKKLEMPIEEIEYLLDVNHRLMFTDLTKVKIVAEGQTAIRRIAEGLKCRGDIDSLFARVKSLSPHDYRVLEERIGLEDPGTKKQAVEELIARYYQHPDSVVTYVATQSFSDTAREVFDIVWQSKKGIMPASQIRVAHGGPEHKVEEALWELTQGCALFEMFRFDTEDRLVRMIGVLKEIRSYSEGQSSKGKKAPKLKALRAKPERVYSQNLDFSDTICKLLAAIAAKPVRLRGDGELFREDRRRLGEICAEEADPSLNTCLWAAEGVGWLVRVDNTLRVGDLDKLIQLDRVNRHRVLCDWFLARGDEATSRKLLSEVVEDTKPGAWYEVMDFVSYAVQAKHDVEQPVLKAQGSQWVYVHPAGGSQGEARLARSLEESSFWLGLVDRAEVGGENAISLTEIGRVLLTGADLAELKKAFPARKGEFVVQPNFDIVVPTQDMDPLLSVPLDQFAVRGSTGQATVYNVGKESFTQALQDGHDADAFVEFLLAHNRGGSLPPNVMQTLEDWRGGMKRVRVRTIHIVESEDPLVIADLTHRRRFSKLLEPMDPARVVRFHDISKKELSKALEKDGFIVD